MTCFCHRSYADLIEQLEGMSDAVVAAPPSHSKQVRSWKAPPDSPHGQSMPRHRLPPGTELEAWLVQQ